MMTSGLQYGSGDISACPLDAGLNSSCCSVAAAALQVREEGKCRRGIL